MQLFLRSHLYQSELFRGVKPTAVMFASLLFNSSSGESANAVPHYHKLCSRDFHIWEIRRGQHSRSAMAEPRPGWTTFMIMVSPLPGKYELYTVNVGKSFHCLPYTAMVIEYIRVKFRWSGEKWKQNNRYYNMKNLQNKSLWQHLKNKT